MKKSILMRVNFILLISCLLSSFVYSSNNGDIKKKFKKFLSLDILEKTGFEHFSDIEFQLFFLKDDFFILNLKDHLLTRFQGKTLQNSYKESGQGPGGMIDPRSIFLYDADTLAIFDITKRRILLFDLKLNFIKEIKLNSNFRKIQKDGNGFTAFGDFGKKIFARLDSNFKLIDTFLEPDRTLPFKDLSTYSLYMGYLFRNGNVVCTYWQYLKKECQADIYNLKTKKKIVSLKWKNPHPPTQKDISSRINFYSSYYISECGEFYITQNDFSKNLKAVSQYDLLIFKKTGELHSKHPFPFGIIDCNSTENDSRLFFLDDEEGISYIDLNEL